MQDTLNSIEAKRTLGDIRFTAACIPPDARGGWTLKELYSQESLDRDPASRTRLGTALAGYVGSAVFAPSVGYHSGAILSHVRDLNRRIEFPNGITMYRNADVRADGVFLKPGQSFVMSAAGCMAVVAAGVAEDGSSHLIAAHASRDSMLDRRLIEDERPSRKHESVVEAIVEAMRKRNVSPDAIVIRGYFSLPRKCFEHPFEHPEYGEYNLKMAAYVSARWGNDCVSVEDTDEGQSAFLDIPFLLVHQANELGVADAACEHSFKLSGPFAHTRHPVQRLRNERNLCIVHRSR